MFLGDLFISLLTILVILLLASFGFGWLLLHYPNMLTHYQNMLTPLIMVLVSLFLIVVVSIEYADFKKSQSDKGVLIGEPLVMDNDTITFRKKRILNKYIIFPEINGKRDESLFEFINSPEESEVTAAVNRLIKNIQ